MTACKDSLNGKKAVSATLAGVLAVGMVPAAAFADAAQADTTDEAGIELQASDAQTFEAGTVNEVTYYDNEGDVVDTTDGDVTYTLGSDVKSIAITSITPQVAGAKAVSFEAEDWTVTYAKAVAGTDKDNLNYTEDLPTTAGTWYMKSVCKATGDDNKAASGATIYTEVKVVANALEGSTVKFAYTENGKKVYKDALTFENVNVIDRLEFFAPDGTTELDSSNADIEYYKVGGDEALTSIVTAGDYVAEITGKAGKKYAGQRASVKFTVSPLDLSKASIVVPDTTATTFDGAIADMTINGEKVSDAIKGLLTVKMDTTDKYSYSDNGKYTVTVSADSNAKDVQTTAVDGKTPAGNKATDSITGTAKADFYKVADTAVFKYGETALNGAGVTETKSIDVDLSVKKPAYFDIDNVTATLTKGGTVDPDDISVVSVTDKETGAAATEADLKTAGTWVVTLGVDRGSDFAQGGTAQLIVKVTNGKVKGTDVFVSVAGENVPGNNKSNAKALEYTGENLLDSIDVVVKYKGKELAQGTDYTVKVTNAKGDDVDEIVNVADGYKVTVESDTYDLTETAATDFYFDVTPVAIGEWDTNTTDKYTKNDLGKIRIQGLNDYGNGKFASYTGEAIEPVIEYIASVDKDSKADWKVLPAEQYKLTVKDKKTDKAVAEIKDEGAYVLTIKDVKDTETTKNYTVGTKGTYELKVSSERVFKDVPNGKYFTDPIYSIAYGKDYQFGKKYDASGKEVACGIMTGYNGSDFFGPYNELTRAETATLLGRLAGVNVDGDDYVSDMGGYATQFTDVQKGAWYANAVAWAAKAGVVTGYSADTFAPDQSITREQFALMLYRYADKCGFDTTADAADLAALPDASGVSDWAETAVEWAVSKGFIGQGGVADAQGTITRGMAATIMVRFMDAYLVK